MASDPQVRPWLAPDSGKTSSNPLLAAVRRQGIRRTSGVSLYIQIAESLEDALTRADLPMTTRP